jgi:restriction system protein
MAIPTFDQFIDPILRFLASHPEGATPGAVHNAAADALKLSAEDRQIYVPSGAKQVYRNRANWAHERLKRAGLSSSPRRALWQLTASGLEFSRTHPGPLNPADLQAIGLALADEKPSAAAPAPVPIRPLASPDERLDEAVSEIRASVAIALAELLQKTSPEYFENIVLDLLHRMGYGASRADLQRVGGTGDAGIDGIISLDKLGLEKVYVQAKRWQNTVGRPEIQAFYGALAGQRAKKGVFITTSAYTTQAQDFARSVEGIILVDGRKLAELMIDYEVGVSARTIKIPRIDSDYFDEEAG